MATPKMPVIAFMGYVEPAKLIVVTVPSEDRIAKPKFDLHDASAYAITPRDVQSVLVPDYIHLEDVAGAYSDAWVTIRQFLAVSSDEEIILSHNAMHNKPNMWYWRIGSHTSQSLRSLNPDHFDFTLNETGQITNVVSKPRSVVYAGYGGKRAVAITMIGDDRTSAELYVGKGEDLTISRRLTDAVVLDDEDPKGYTISFGCGQQFTYGDAELFRKDFYRIMRKAGTSRRAAKDVLNKLHQQSIPEKGYFGNLHGGLGTIDDLSRVTLDEANGTVTFT